MKQSLSELKSLVNSLQWNLSGDKRNIDARIKNAHANMEAKQKEIFSLTKEKIFSDTEKIALLSEIEEFESYIERLQLTRQNMMSEYSVKPKKLDL